MSPPSSRHAGVDLVELLLQDAPQDGAGQGVLPRLAAGQAALERGGHLRQEAVQQLDPLRIEEARVAPEAQPRQELALRAELALHDVPLGAAVDARQHRRIAVRLRHPVAQLALAPPAPPTSS